MKYYFIFILFFINLNKFSFSACPCSNQTLCEPVNVGYRKEFLGFSVNSTQYPYYDYDTLTTIGIFYNEPIADEFLCTAHSKNVRLVYGVSYPIDQLGNFTYRSEWIQSQLERVQSTYVDGLNFDVEDPITDEITSKLYTNLVDATNNAFKSVNENYQITVDIAWSPNCIDERCYDYNGLSIVSDFMVVMDYDMRSRVFGVSKCLASANSPPELIIEGLLNFTKMGIATDDMLMGLPFYGYNYSCINNNMTIDTNECIIPPGSYLGCNCTDAVGNEVNYSTIMEMLENDSIEKSQVQWDPNFDSPFFNFIDPNTKTRHQMWFDNPMSLLIKVKIAQQFQLRGVSVWNIDQLNINNPTQSNQMWDVLSDFFNHEFK